MRLPYFVRVSRPSNCRRQAMSKAHVAATTAIPLAEFARPLVSWRENALHVLRGLDMVARMQLACPSMTAEQLAQAVVDAVERITAMEIDHE
jgi:hypothetical protein